MELRHLRYFVAVAEELNFRRAAERLHLAQPPLSAQIKALETELGVRLFDRSTRSVRLTEAGRILLDEARQVLLSARQAEQRTRQVGLGLQGTLRIGIIAPSANAWMASILREFRQLHPGVKLALFDLVSTDQLRRLRDDELDVGVLRPPVHSLELEYQYVEESRQVLAVPTGHRLATKAEIVWTDFHDEALVLIDPGLQHGYYDRFFQACAQAGAVPRPAQFANDIQTKMWLISAGFGIAPTTASLAEISRPGLTYRELPPGMPMVRSALVWKRNNDSPAVQALVQLMLARRQSLGGSTD